MGIRFNLKKEGETKNSLTEHSIKAIKFGSTTATDLSPKINDITNSVSIEGVINFDKINEKPRPMLDDYGYPVLDENGVERTELREIDSVRQLANWSIIPEYLDCYLDLKVDTTNSRGRLVKETSFDNLFVISYEESYSDARGHGKFVVQALEKESIKSE